MSTGNDGLSTLEGVADFLDTEVADAVPAELRGEVRAAVKLLRTSALELSVRHREVGEEIEELLTLCDSIALADGDADLVDDLRTRARDSVLSLRQQEALRVDVAELTARTMARLAERGDPGLADFLRCLGRHAARRTSWQSVFPVDTAGVHE